MQTKLTLRIDDELIERAKSYAQRSGKSVSRIVADYLELLPEPEPRQARPLTPIVKSMVGTLAGSGLDEEDYRRHLKEKHL